MQVWKRGRIYVGGFCKFLFLKFKSPCNRSVTFNAFGQPHWWSLLRGEETREPVLSCTENKDGHLFFNICVILSITWNHGKHKTKLIWLPAQHPSGSSIGSKVGSPCPGGVCVLYMYASTYMYVNVCVLKSHSDCLMSRGLQQGTQQNWVGWRGAVPFIYFFHGNLNFMTGNGGMG